MICRGDFTAKWLGFDPVRPDGNGLPPLGRWAGMAGRRGLSLSQAAGARAGKGRVHLVAHFPDGNSVCEPRFQAGLGQAFQLDERLGCRLGRCEWRWVV